MAENRSNSKKILEVQGVVKNSKDFEKFAKLLNEVGGSYDKIRLKLEKFTKSQKDAAEKTVKSATSLKQSLGRIQTYIDYRIINNVVSSMKSLTKATIDLQSSFANIQAITRSTDATMAKLQKTILKVGEASKYSVTEISDATTMLGQAGLSAEEINNVLETTTQLAAATGSSLADTIDLMTSSLAVWGVSSEEASHLSDVMVTGMNRTKATLQTFRMAVQYAGATMASLNVNFDEFASVASAAANAGIKASVVGTGLRAVASELISPTTKMVKGLAKLGLTTEDVNIESNGLVNVLKKLKDAGLDASNAYSLFGRRAAQFILAAQGQLDVVDDLQVAFVESGATLEAYNKQMNTVAAEWTALSNTVKEAAYRTLQETNGFIHDMIVAVKGGIQSMLTDEIDAFNEEIKKSDEIISNLDLYSDLVKRNKNKNYKGDTKEQLKDYNNLVKSLNSVYNANLDIADSVEGIAEKYEQLIMFIEEYRKKAIEIRNQGIVDKKESIFETGFGTLSFQKDLTSEQKEAYRTQFQGFYNKYESQLKEAGENVEQVYSNLLEEENKRFEERNEKIGKLFLGRQLSHSEEISEIEEINERIHELRINALEAVKDSLSLVELRNPQEEQTIRTALSDLNTNYSEILKDMSETFSETSENLEEYLKSPSEEIEKKKAQIQGEIDKLKEILEREDVSLLKNKDSITEKIEEFEKKLTSKLQASIDKKIEFFINLLGEQNEAKYSETRTKQLKDLLDLQGSKSANPWQSLLDKTKQEKKDSKNAGRTAKEIERERAREFNKKYQNLKLQSQADSYAQSTAEAMRKGVLSKLDTRDTSGVLSGYYSDVSGDLSKLESLRTAISNKETLDAYKKDYGEIFEQVKRDKVTLDEADNKTAGLINEMLKLDASVAQATAEFGSLDEIDLSNVDSQIKTLQDKLKEIEESGEIWYKQLAYGFSSAIESMSKSYTNAKLGATIAEDLSSGVSDALYSVVDGSKKAKDAFSDMARSILEDISKLLIKMAVLKMFEAVVGFTMGGGENMSGQSSGWNPSTSAPSVKPTFANGGFIPKIRAAVGTKVSGGVPGKDSVPAMLMPGEYVLKKSAVDALGTNFLNDLNENAAQTLTKTAANLMDNGRESKENSEPAVVNVWVVSKEEEAKMGPNDVIATISKDIMTGGTTRRLIQSVVAGRK